MEMPRTEAVEEYVDALDALKAVYLHQSQLTENGVPEASMVGRGRVRMDVDNSVYYAEQRLVMALQTLVKLDPEKLRG